MPLTQDRAVVSKFLTPVVEEQMKILEADEGSDKNLPVYSIQHPHYYISPANGFFRMISSRRSWSKRGKTKMRKRNTPHSCW